MKKLVFPGDELDALATVVRAAELETFALVLARAVQVSTDNWRLLVQSVHVPSEHEYEVRTKTEVRPTPAFRLPLEKRAHNEGLSLIYCHSHPAQHGVPKFSSTDDRSEKALARYARERVPNVPHLSLLIGAEGIASRELGAKSIAEVWQVGRQVKREFPAPTGGVNKTHDRQVRAFGPDGQHALQSLRVGIVGCGGTGSIIVQELAHLGVDDFMLIDPDRLSRTNLNRVVGATPKDVGRPKVDIAARLIRGLVPGARIEKNRGDILVSKVGRQLLNVDLVFCCTDSEGSRHLLNQLVYQYFIPVIDMGVSITPRDGEIASIDGRVQMLSPSLGCLICIEGRLNGRRVMWDLQNRRQRMADPYFREWSGIKQPSVISLNGTVASQAVTMLLSAVAGVPINARSIWFRGLRGDARVLDDAPRPQCANCSTDAYYGKGGTFSLPERSR